MQFRTLKVYCDIVRLGSFSKAAELNGVSQPSASQLVNHLEGRLGAKLIDRSRRPFVVTEAGQRFFEGSLDLVRRLDDLERQVRQCVDSPGGRLRVGAIYSIGLGQMHRIVALFRAERPGVELQTVYMRPQQLLDALAAEEIDLAVTSYAEANRQFAAIPWRDETFAVAAPPGHPLAQSGRVTADGLAGQRMVMPESGLRVRDELDRWLASRRVRPAVAAEFDNLESVKRAVEVGEGITLLPIPTFTAEVRAGTLARVDLVDEAGLPEEFVRPLGVLHRRGEDLSDAAQGFLDLLRRHADAAGATAPGEPLRKPAASGQAVERAGVTTV